MGAAIPSLQAGLLNQSSAQMVDGGLRFNPGDSPILSRTVGSGNRATWTWSGWIKRSGLTVIRDFFSCGVNIHNGGAGGAQANAYFEGDGTLQVIEYSGGYGYRYKTTQVFRDASDWYHIVISLDTTNSTAGDRVKIYVNGNRVTSFTTSTAPALNFEGEVNRGGVLHYISDTVAPFDGYLSQINFIDGQSLGPENFGFTDPLTNTWRPKKYTGDFNSYTLTAPTYRSSSGSDVTSTEFDKMVDNNLSTYGQGNGASGTNRFIGFNLSSTAYPSINVKIKNTTGGALDFMIQPSVSGSGIVSQGTFASTGNNNGTVNVAANTTLEDTFSFPSGYEGFGRIYLNNSGNAADAWEIYDFGGTKVTTNSFYLPLDGNSPIGEDKSGNGNNWTPNNFGGSVALDKATGALPILNTDGGGNVARPGVFGSEVGAYYAVTVAAVGGGNRYHFDGVDRPNPTLIRGATYTFDQSDSSNSGHPLRFATAADAAGSSQYTDGVSASGTPGSAGAYTKITVPHNSPNTLHYYCTNHGGMGSSTSQITDETKADPYAWKNTLALPLVGNSSDVSNSVNSGSTTKTITNNGVNTSNANSNFYGGSHYWDGGTTDRLTVTYNSEFQFGTGDFCVEFWVNLSTTSGNQYFWDFDTNGGNLQYNSNVLSYSDGVVAGSGPLYSTGITLPTDKWVHLAFTRESGTGRIFVDGAMRATGTTTYNYNQTSVLDIGNGYNNSGYEITGYMQDFRIYKGVAKYTNSFVVPATSPDILPDTPSGVSGSSKLTKITDGAVSFDGTGDYLSLGSNSDFNFGTGTFTIEGFFYKNATTSLQTLLASQQYYQSGNDGNWVLRVSSATQIAFASYNGTSSEEYSEFSAPNGVGSWHHFAFVREGTGSNQSKFYYDGKLAGSMTVSKSLTDGGSNGIFIGDDGSGPNNAFNGFLSNVRVIKGTALYTANFTPPSAPLTNVTNTKLLCCQSNTSAIEGAVKPGTITANGNAAATNFNPFNTDINTVRGQETGYATFNPLGNKLNGGVMSNGNLRLSGTGSQYIQGRSTIPVFSNDSYCEVHVSSGTGSSDVGIGIGDEQSNIVAGAGSYITYRESGTVTSYPGNVTEGTISSYSVGDTIGMAVDSTNIRFFKNGALVGTFAHGKTGDFFAIVMCLPSNTTLVLDANFGQKPFKFPPPAGFQPLNGTTILPETVITRPDHYVGATLYTGDGGASKSISGLNFGGKPDLVWVKGRSYSISHLLYDSVRGAGSTKSLVPNGPNSEGSAGDNATFGYVSSFDNNGFSLVGGSDVNNGYVNKNTATYVAWCWKAGGDKNTFNVDDVGYASASDVGMNIGGQNSNAYNQSQTWSNSITTTLRSGDPATKGFDGDITTSTVVAATDAIMNVDFSNITVNSKIEVIGQNGFTTPNCSVTVGGTTTTAGGDPNTGITNNSGGTVSRVFNVSGTLTNIKIGKINSSRTRLSQVIVDGKILVDNGVTPPNAPSIAATGASVGTKQGFSILKFTNDTTSPITLSHGLTQAPTFVILKALTGSVGWTVGHTSIGFTKRLKLNGTDAESASANFFNNIAPSSSVITLGANNVSNDFIMYSWHDVPGLQKFGSYEGNNNADGAFIELGFRPAIIWMKNIDSTGPWNIYDNKRDTFNGATKILLANTSGGGNANDAFVGSYPVDFLSNGFKIRNTTGEVNSAHTFIYCAWAEAPTVNLFGGQSNAR